MASIMKSVFGSSLLTEPLDASATELPSPNQLKNKILIKSKSFNKTLDHVQNDGEGDVFEEDEAAEALNFSTKNLSKQLKLCAELSDLIVYFKSKNFCGFNHANHKFYNISSFNETKAKWLINKSMDEALVHHEKHLSRVYPGASRTNSSNFDPTIFWASGFQMVAINYQTPGVERDIYFGKFKQNGNCGFIRKPDFIENFSKVKVEMITKNQFSKIISR